MQAALDAFLVLARLDLIYKSSAAGAEAYVSTLLIKSSFLQSGQNARLPCAACARSQWAQHSVQTAWAQPSATDGVPC